MRIHFPTNLIAVSRRSCKLILLFLWIIGFLCGVVCAAYADNLTSLMRTCFSSGVSIVGLLSVPILPFLISAVAVYCSAPLILYFTGFCKAFLIGFSLCVVHSVFDGGGWLICLLLFFTDLLTAPVLMLFQLRYCGCEGTVRPRDILFPLFWFALVGAVDCFAVVPFLRDIL